MTKAGGRSRKKEERRGQWDYRRRSSPLFCGKGCILVVAIVVALFFQGYIAFEVISGQFGESPTRRILCLRNFRLLWIILKNEHTRQKFPKRSTGSICAIRKACLVRISVPGEGDVYLQNNGYHEGHAGHTRLPDIFYRGVFFGLSAWNAHIDEERDSSATMRGPRTSRKIFGAWSQSPTLLRRANFRASRTIGTSKHWSLLRPRWEEEIDKMMLMHKMRLLGRVPPASHILVVDAQVGRENRRGGCHHAVCAPYYKSSSRTQIARARLDPRAYRWGLEISKAAL